MLSELWSWWRVQQMWERTVLEKRRMPSIKSCWMYREKLWVMSQLCLWFLFEGQQMPQRNQWLQCLRYQWSMPNLFSWVQTFKRCLHLKIYCWMQNSAKWKLYYLLHSIQTNKRCLLHWQLPNHWWFWLCQLRYQLFPEVWWSLLSKWFWVLLIPIRSLHCLQTSLLSRKRAMQNWWVHRL